MSERIENILTPLEQGTPTPFIDSPGEFLCKAIAQLLKAVPQWALIYGDDIDGYKRMDYGIRQLPALRIYTDGDTKDFEDWFVEGDIILDSILPASIRRNDMQQIQDSLAAAMMQQFRRPSFFNAVTNFTPGLNELGKRFVTDKSLGYAWQDGEEPVPLTQMTVNFKIDLRQWDNYLESTNRTKDDPFETTLATLAKIALKIQALNDDGTINTTVPTTGQDTIVIKNSGG